MRRFDVAVVGCGGVSLMHYLGFQNHQDRVRVVAACDLDEARVKEAQTKHGFEKAFTSLEQMIDGAQWDVAVVCTPTPVREAVVKQLAAAGKHIHVEKPFADSLEAALHMVEACDKAGVRITVGQNFRYHYPFHTAKKLIDDGRLGKVCSINHQEQCFRQDQGWRLDCDRHVLSIMGIHWFDGFRWTLGQEATTLASVMCSSPAIRCKGETEAFTIITFDGGTIVSYNETFTSPIGRTETLLVGEKGMVVLGYEGATFYTKENPREPQERFENPYAGYNKVESAFRALEELLTSIETGKEPSNSGRDNLRTVSLLEGAYRAASSNETVRFEKGLLV